MIAMHAIARPRRVFLFHALLPFLFLTPNHALSAEEFTVLLPGGVPMTLVKVPGGAFQMGSPEGERGNLLGNETQHQVTLTRDYYLGKTEITLPQWQAVTGLQLPTQCNDLVFHDNQPISCVSWDQVAGPGGFIEKLNQLLTTTGFRLPTEAEWERAARAGTTTRYAHGDVLECSDECGGRCEEHSKYMWYCDNSGRLACIDFDPVSGNCLRFVTIAPEEVGKKLPNPYGLHDMHGNMWEWVQDRYGDFSPQGVTDPIGPAVGSDRVIRGGQWASEPRLSRSASRAGASPESQGSSGNPGSLDGIDGFGFRIAITSVEELGIQINSGLNDAWYNPATNGQGFLISVFPDRKEMFLAWFTFDAERPPEDVDALLGEPGHRWLTAQGPYVGNTANLTIYVTEGGVFDAAEPTVTTNLDGDGTMKIEFADCGIGLVSYEIASLSIAGEIPIQRITNDNVALCETLSGQ